MSQRKYQAKYLNTETHASEPAPKKKRSRRPRTGTVVFYTLYLLVILAFFVGMQYVLEPLQDWLVMYEASQPERKCSEVFEELFAQPDWAALYTLAGTEDTAYEGKDAFAAYMEANAAGKEITYVETSAGLSGDHKYIVKLGDEKIATFTLTGGAQSQTEIPEWELGTVELFFTRQQSVTVDKLPGHTVYINGVALDDSHTIRTVSTAVESYLPEGIHGYRMEQQHISGLLADPVVTVTDESGAPVTMTRDSQTGIYTPVLSPMEMTDDERAQVEDAVTVFSQYMIKATSLTQLRKRCVPDSEIYQTISDIDRWMQSYLSYEISPIAFTEFYRYTDTLFSVRAKLTNSVTRNDGTVKDYEMDSTWFFSKNAEGKWLISDMTQVDVSRQTEQVRLTFVNNDQVLDSFFVDAESNSLTLPAVTVPEGKVFGGWVQKTDDGSGKITLTIVFTPDENGAVTVAPGTALEPMTLYTLFEDEGAQE